MPIIKGMGDEANRVLKCPNCAKLEERVAELEARVAELLRRLDCNSSNSSKPPSSDPPGHLPSSRRTRSGKNPGGQPGHPGAFRERLPIERVKEVVDHIPKTCAHCNASLAGQYGPHWPEASWHQVAELPQVLAEITEHRGHERTCACCGKTTCAEIPAEIRAHCAGPNLTAALSYMSGRMHASKRSIQEFCETLLSVPLSLGTLSKLEAETSAALETPHAEALEAVRAAPVKNVDETGWAKRGKLCWLWLAATASIAVFAIHAKRGKVGFKNLLGKAVFGIVCSDRWSAYALVDVLNRQLCWAHLKRDFQKFKEMGGEARNTGNAGLRAVKKIFEAWHEWKTMRIDRAELQERLASVRMALHGALERGRDGPDKKVRTFCKRLLKDYEAMWLFADVEGVEPTNNHAERCLRPAVMWRKRSFGNHSEEGCRFTERLLTAVHTLKLQKRPVLEYLKSAVINYRAGRLAPSLLTS